MADTGSPTGRSGPAVTYERHPGAASAAFPSGYRRREPEKSVLHGVVREHLETFLARGHRGDGEGYPRFIEKEFRRYLDCGLLCHGFARLRCPSCGHENLIAFSCKGRLCPSCMGRRTAEIAASLVDQLLPEAGYRQWVLTFPWSLRFPLAVDRDLLARLTRAFLCTLFSWQRRRGRAVGMRDGRTGAVNFVQRFGGALNLHPHLHSILPDGLFVPGPQGRLTFTPLPAPTTLAESEETRAERASGLDAAAVTPEVLDSGGLPDASEERRGQAQAPTHRRRLAWAQLLRRVLHVDALQCPRCSAAMVALAFLSDPLVVGRILRHLHLPTAPPPVSPARSSAEERLDVFEWDVAGEWSEVEFVHDEDPVRRARGWAWVQWCGGGRAPPG